jgi:hypothetical protein
VKSITAHRMIASQNMTLPIRASMNLMPTAAS